MKKIADIIAMTVKDFEGTKQTARQYVNEIAEKFPL
jgi:hypothetical protein